MAKDEKTALPSEQLSKKGGNPKDVVRISGYATETEEIKNKLVSISTRCQFLESKVTGKKVLQGSFLI